MTKWLPWGLCLVLGLALVYTHFSVRGLPNAKLPAELADFSPSTHWLRVDAGKKSALWKDGPVWAFTSEGRLVALLADGDNAVQIFRNGKVIAWLPLGNKMYDNMRAFYYTGTNGSIYSVIDSDGDSEIDSKFEDGHFWLYQHGQFTEAVSTDRYQRVKHLLDGTPLVLDKGRWRVLKQEGSNNVTGANGSALRAAP